MVKLLRFPSAFLNCLSPGAKFNRCVVLTEHRVLERVIMFSGSHLIIVRAYRQFITDDTLVVGNGGRSNGFFFHSV